MGEKPGDVEQEIRATRDAISRKLDGMTERGKEDVNEVSGRVQEFFQSSPLNKAVDSQPLLSVLGALGVGVVLGMASAKPGNSAPSAQAFRPEPASPLGQGILGGLMASLEGMAVEEGRQILHEWMAPARGNGNGRRDGKVPHI